MNRGHMEPLAAILRTYMDVTGAMTAAVTPFALVAAIESPGTARRLRRTAWRHLNGLPTEGRTITGHATTERTEARR